MSSAAAKASQEIELNPQTIIVANDLDRFASFAAMLEKSGFPCRRVQTFPDEETQPSTIYFVSFNLQSTNATALSKNIEQMGMMCIVFAEEPGVAVAAKLSSAKMTQTLQHPYTEKNFVMAVQTIVKNRAAQYEKDMRKKQHGERLKAQQKTKGGQVTDAGIIIQEAAHKVGDDSAKVFKGEKKAAMSILQVGQASKGFFAIQEGAKPAESRHAKGEPAPTFAKKSELKPAVAEAPAKKKETPATEEARSAAGPARLSVVKPTDETTVEPVKSTSDKHASKPAAREERPMSHFWAVLIMCLLGSSICLYCVYEILFGT